MGDNDLEGTKSVIINLFILFVLALLAICICKFMGDRTYLRLILIIEGIGYVIFLAVRICLFIKAEKVSNALAKRIESEINALMDNSEEIDANSFISNMNPYLTDKLNSEISTYMDNAEEIDANSYVSNKKHSNQINQGCFILYNATKNKLYLGKGSNVAHRAYWYLCIGGNVDIYTDFASGDTLTVKVLPLEDSTFTNLNELESALFNKLMHEHNGLDFYNELSWGMY